MLIWRQAVSYIGARSTVAFDRAKDVRNYKIYAVSLIAPQAEMRGINIIFLSV